MASITLTDARVAGPLMALLMYFPHRLKRILPRKLRPFLKSPLLLKLLMTIVGFDLIRKTSNAVSRYMSNNGRSVVFRNSQELVLISGGCSGIGLLMATEFARRGVKVIVLDLNESAEPLPANVHYYKCNVTSIPEIAETAAAIRNDHGDPTVLINNAGIARIAPILKSTEKSIRDTFEVNTISHFWMVREFVPSMIKNNHGHVVTIASMASYVAHPLIVDYCCSKSSALVFHEGLSIELKHLHNAPNIRTTTINPSWIRTPLIETQLKDENWKAPVMEPDYVIQKIVNQVMTGESGHLILPQSLFMNFLSTVRSWPLWAQLYVRYNLGKEFKDFKSNVERET